MKLDSNHTTEQIVSRGQAMYEEKIRRIVERPDNVGKLLCLDVETGEYAIGMDHYALVKKIQAGRSNSQLFTLRIGYPAAFARGIRMTPSSL